LTIESKQTVLLKSSRALSLTYVINFPR